MILPKQNFLNLMLLWSEVVSADGCLAHIRALPRDSESDGEYCMWKVYGSVLERYPYGKVAKQRWSQEKLKPKPAATGSQPTLRDLWSWDSPLVLSQIETRLLIPLSARHGPLAVPREGCVLRLGGALCCGNVL